MKPKKKFTETVVGKVIAAVPKLAGDILGVSSLDEVIDAITGSNIPAEDKIKAEQIALEGYKVYLEANKSADENFTRRVESDNQNAFTRKVRPRLTYYYTFLNTLLIIFDSIDSLAFTLSNEAIVAITTTNGLIITFWFAGRTIERLKGKV